MERESERVVIGIDPHKRSLTIEVMDAGEKVLGGGRFVTDIVGYRGLLGRWPDRVWAIVGCGASATT